MREIQCVRNLPGKNPAQDDYLKKLMKEVGLGLKFFTWDAPAISASNPLLLIVDEDNIDALNEICEERDLKVIVGLNTRRDFKIVPTLKSQIDKIFGFIDLSQEIEYNLPLLQNYLNLNFTSNQISLKKLASDIEKVYDFTKSELTKIKDLHERLVKVRIDNFKGVTVTSKFMAGEKSGGEFFDIIQSDHNIVFIQAGSDNYIVSSMILAELEVLKLSSPTTSLKNQSENFEKMITHHAKENNGSLSYCVVNIDLKNLQADFTFKGEGYLFYQGTLIDFSHPVRLKLKPAEKFYLLSNGSLKNLKELNTKLSVKNFYSEHAEKNTRDLINEFFFEVSRNKAGNFLNYDALMAVIEIDQKTLYQL
jgi:hypothetical protein